MNRKFFTAEITLTVDDIGTQQKFIFSTQGFATKPTDTPANTVIHEYLEDPGNLRRELFSNAKVDGPVRPSFGQIVLTNHSGVLDDWISYGIAGGLVTVRYGQEGADYPAGFSTVYVAYAYSVIVDFDRVRVVLRDLLYKLEAPVVTDIFRGTGGLEGTGLAQRKKQMVFGRPGFIPPVLIDNAKQIYFVQDNAADERCFRSTSPPLYLPFEGGRGLNFEGFYTSETELISGPAPSAGFFKIWGPGVDGLTSLTSESTGPIYFRLGSPPEYEMRFPSFGLLKNGAGEAARPWTFFDLGTRANIDIVMAPGSYRKNVGNILVEADQTYLEIMSDACKSTFSSFGFNRLGEFFTINLQDPTEGTDPSVYTFALNNSKEIKRQPVPGGEAPIWQVSVNVGRTWPTSSLRTSLSPSERDIFERSPWQSTFTGTSAAVKRANPGAESATVEIQGNDLVSPAAKEAFIQRYLYLFGARRELITLTTELNEDTMALELHQKVTLRMPRFGCDFGRLFRIITLNLNCRARTVTVGLWGGPSGPVDGVLGGGATSPGGGSGVPARVRASGQIGDFEMRFLGRLLGGGGGGNSNMDDGQIIFYGRQVDLVPEFIAYGEQSAVPQDLTIPAHAANDLLILFLRSNASPTPPAVPSGWTDRADLSVSFGSSWRVVSQVDMSNTISSMPLATAYQMAVVIVRNGDIGNIAVGAEAAGTSTTLPTLTISSSGSKVLAGVTCNQLTGATTPSGMTELGSNESPNLGGGTWAIWASDDVEATFTGRTTTHSTGTYYSSWAIELVPL